MNYFFLKVLNNCHFFAVLMHNTVTFFVCAKDDITISWTSGFVTDCGTFKALSLT